MNVADRRVRRALLLEAERIGAEAARSAGGDSITGKHAEMLAFARLANTVWATALAGERWAVEFVRDSIDGRPHQSHSVDGDGEGGAIKTLHEIVLRAIDAVDGRPAA